MRLKRSLAATLAVLLLVPPGLPAAPLATLHGSLVSTTGRPLAGLELGLVNLDTGGVVSVRSDHSGTFTASLPPGLYTVDAARGGYAISGGPRVVSLAAGKALSATLSLAAMSPQAAAPSASAFRFDHTPIACMIADQHPSLDADAQPVTKVTNARAYFRSSLSPDFFYVEMVPAPTGGRAGRLAARLPRPKLDAGPVIYYVEAVTSDYAGSRSGEIIAIVVREQKDCPSKKPVAALAPGEPVSVYSAAGLPAVPPGFTGALSVAGPALAGAAIGGGGTPFFQSTAGVVTVGLIGFGAGFVTGLITGLKVASPSK